MTVRRISSTDLDWLYDLTVKFNDEHYGVPLNYHKTVSYLEWLIENGIAFRSDAGAIIGMVAEDPFRDTAFLVEIGWYSNDSSGIKLLDAFIQAGADAGADEVRMTTLEAYKSAGTILRRRKFNPIEVSWGLQLGDTHGSSNADGDCTRN